MQCIVTDGDATKLISDMMDILRALSNAAYEKIKDSYEDVLEQIAEVQTGWDEREHAAQSPEGGDDANDKESRPPTNPYKSLML